MDYTAKVRFVFEGTVSIKDVKDKTEAISQINNNLGLCIGGDIHTSSPNIEDWEFNVHSEKQVISCRKNG